MKTHKRLLSVTVRAGNSAGHARRRISAIAVRRMAAGAIAALAFGSLGLSAAASAWSAQGAAGHVQAPVHQAATAVTATPGTVSTGALMIKQLPWMY